MANQEHLDILAKGVGAWNAWRGANLNARPNLSNAVLSGVGLSGADLSSADLSRADLSNADLTGVDLFGASMSGANLCGVDLGGADLTGSNLSRADLSNADLTGANLGGTILTEASLSGAKFDHARVRSTRFVDVDLSTVKGLDTGKHVAPSSVGIDTIYRSKGEIPESFLRGAGVPENFITYMRSLTGTALDFYSVFISYSTRDQAFADRLYADLQAKGVRCWFAPHDIQSGRKLHEQIDEAIRVYDKLLLILSDASMNSEWVGTEISKARKRERKEDRRMLFPISLAPFDAIRDWGCFDADAGKDSAREIREYFVPDFSNWKSHDSYTTAFERLVRDLKSAPDDKVATKPAP